MPKKVINGYKQLETPYDELMKMEPRRLRKAKYNNLVARVRELYEENLDLKQGLKDKGQSLENLEKEIKSLRDYICSENDLPHGIHLGEYKKPDLYIKVTRQTTEIASLKEDLASETNKNLHLLRAISSLTDAMRDYVDPELPPF